MKRYEFKHLNDTNEPANTIFCYKRAHHQPARCEFERLVRILLFDSDQILLYYNESVVANLIRLHVVLFLRSDAH